MAVNLEPAELLSHAESNSPPPERSLTLVLSPSDDVFLEGGPLGSLFTEARRSAIAPPSQFFVPLPAGFFVSRLPTFHLTSAIAAWIPIPFFRKGAFRRYADLLLIGLILFFFFFSLFLFLMFKGIGEPSLSCRPPSRRPFFVNGLLDVVSLVCIRAR